MSGSERVMIYTDGACSGNPGPGGWAAILFFKGSEKEISGGEAHTTNNRMEIRAAIEGLNALKRPCAVDLFTDSQYVRQGITQWMHNWKRRGWRTSAGEPVKNADLWRRHESLLVSRVLRFVPPEEEDREEMAALEREVKARLPPR